MATTPAENNKTDFCLFLIQSTFIQIHKVVQAFSYFP